MVKIQRESLMNTTSDAVAYRCAVFSNITTNVTSNASVELCAKLCAGLCAVDLSAIVSPS